MLTKRSIQTQKSSAKEFRIRTKQYQIHSLLILKKHFIQYIFITDHLAKGTDQERSIINTKSSNQFCVTEA
jgi:hypothetical protein